MFLFENIIMKNTIFRGRLSNSKKYRLQYLLDMEYSTTELAAEIGFSRRQIYRVYMKISDFPHRRDPSGRIWINGKDFAIWYYQTYPKISLGANETYCLTCRTSVEMINSTRIKKNRLVLLESLCPNCGRKLARINGKVKERENDQSRELEISE
jgi:hypothetical protein